METESILCQKCAKLGGKIVEFKFNGITTARWVCPYCIDNQERETWNKAIQIVKNAEALNNESYEFWKQVSSNPKDFGVLKFCAWSGEDSRIIVTLEAERDKNNV
jgi:hypothetical protein